MYCGNCFRDNMLVAALRRRGHSTLMVPLYLPLTLEEEDRSAGTPVFFGGVNVYLQQKSALFRSAPRWLHDLLASERLLRWTSQFASRTRPQDVGELTVSMLRGEAGNQTRELDELIAWLRTQPRPDVICLSNCLLIGLARRLKADLGVAVVCMLQGEDSFLDALPARERDIAWETVGERAREADLLVAPSHYFAERMSRRLNLSADRLRVVNNGISLVGYEGTMPRSPAEALPPGPSLGYFARMCPEKGLATLVDTFLLLKKRDRVKNLRLRVGGGCGPGDEAFVRTLRTKLRANGVEGDTEFHPNLDRASKIEFLRSLSVFSVPALYGEAFGLYLIEAWAAGVPVVQPRHAAFPELIEVTGGGLLCEPGSPESLADSVETLLLDPAKRASLADAGRAAVERHFTDTRMAEQMTEAFEQALRFPNRV